ncbi:MAG: FAD-binding oxidoreductase [Kiritimatiellia bacterium]
MSRKPELAAAPPRLPVRVLDVTPLGDEVFVVGLSGISHPWTPGDCIAVYAPGSTQSRPYSLSGSNQAERLEVWVRRFPEGLVSPYLCDRRPGDEVEISPPFGWFRPGKPEAAHKIYLATGTGIAPFLSAIRSGCPPPRELHWGLRRPLETGDRLEGVPVTLHISRGEERTGRLTEQLDSIDVHPDTHVYACGLDLMIEQAASHFQTRGLPESRFHRECFFTD